jgi:hypothetical protein
MNRIIIFLLWLSFPLFCIAQPGLIRTYQYDEAGNRTLCKVLQIYPAPPTPPDTTEVDYFETEKFEIEYFVEKIAQVEIKIYPNPTTERVTLEISNMEKLQTGMFKLYSLTGQLLQEHPVYSSATIISLAGHPTGAYILKVHINDRTEDWKIIKN